MPAVRLKSYSNKLSYWNVDPWSFPNASKRLKSYSNKLSYWNRLITTCGVMPQLLKSYSNKLSYWNLSRRYLDFWPLGWNLTVINSATETCDLWKWMKGQLLLKSYSNKLSYWNAWCLKPMTSMLKLKSYSNKLSYWNKDGGFSHVAAPWSWNLTVINSATETSLASSKVASRARRARSTSVLPVEILQ